MPMYDAPNAVEELAQSRKHFNKMGDAIHASGNSVTIDGNNGNVYAGLGKIEKNTSSVEEIKLLYVWH